MSSGGSFVPAVPTLGLRGIVATPHHHATQAAHRALGRGGSAADAAIAAAAVLGVVCPDMCGIGGDVLAVVWDAAAGRPQVLTGTGPAGSGRSREVLAARHPDGLPLHGPDTVTVPGTPRAWEALHARHGRLSLRSLVEPAAELAEDGFACPARLADGVAAVRPPHPDLFDRDGHPVRPGRRVTLAAYAATLRAFTDGGAEALAEGALGADLASVTGGDVAARDLADARPSWDEPVLGRAFDTDIWVPPPSSQAYLVPLAARILEGLAPPTDPDDPRQWHLMIESIKAAAHDRDRVLDDPGAGPPVTVDDVRARRSLVTERSGRVAGFGVPGDTVYLGVVDVHGNAVSMCHSLYHPWGARVYLPRAGVLAQNRGSSFSLDPASPSALAPGLRARTTLSPVVLADGPRLVGTVGTMGGDVQPQAVLQHIVRHRLSGLDVAETLAHPRSYLNLGLRQTIWSAAEEPVLGLEGRCPPAVVADLWRRGHPVRPGPAFADESGHAQMITALGDGWAGAADGRSGTGSVAAG